MSLLTNVQNSCQQIAEAVASALKMEVEIIDDEPLRVAGTGSVRNDVGHRLRRGFVNKYVLNSGKPVFIEEAGYHAICGSCPLKGNCFYRSSIVYPITADNRVIGTISLIAFDKHQKEKLSKNTASLMEFLGRMADLMASKALEKLMLQERMLMAGRLEAVVDAVYEAIIAVDSTGNITHFNKSSERMFSIQRAAAIGQNVNQILSGILLQEVLEEGKEFNSREVFVNLKNRKLHLLSTARIIKDQEDLLLGIVATFRDFKETQKLAYEYISAQRQITMDDILSKSHAIDNIKAQAKKIAVSNSTVLILGETGTGKELFARAIHSASNQSVKPFVAINCGAIPESLLESELFGYDEGAFTGARRGGKPGKFELANGGTLFLDEIGNMSLYLQSKLLRVLQEKTIERVGGTQEIPINVRIIAATNSDLHSMVQKGLFREDLYYRVSVIPIILPPLRERREDIPLLLEYYTKRFSNLLQKDITGFSPEVLKACMGYSWPGNVRELINMVEYAVNLEEQGILGLESLPSRIRENHSKSRSTYTYTGNADDREGIVPLATMEKDALEKSLAKFGYHEEGKRKAANALGISRATIYRKIEKYGLKQKNQ